MEEITKHDKLLEAERQISTQSKIPVTINGKVYKVRQCSNKIETKIHYKLLELYALEKKGNKEEMTLKEAKKLQGRLRRLHSQQAAWYLIGNWGLFIPFLHAIMWRWVDLKTSEFAFYIISTAQGGAGKGFFTLLWANSKAQLKQSMNGLLQGEDLLSQRMASVEEMLKEDFGKSQDSK